MAINSQFDVCGTGEFPLDMLRRDSCWPASTDDANKLHSAVTGARTVCLNSIERRPNTERWASFGWEVLQSTPRGRR